MARLIDADALFEKVKESSEDAGFYTPIYNGFLASIVNAPTIEQPKWISCEERLPTAEDANEYSEMLAIDKNGKRTACQLWTFNSSYKPLWWMPFSALPEPPKGGKRDEP